MKFKQVFESNKSAGMSIEDIAAKHSVSVEMIKSQIQLGLKVEKEHTDDIALAMQITLDHLTELPDYYSRLDKMETESITEAKITTTDGHAFKSPKEAYKAMLLGGSDDDEIMTALPDIKLPAHKYYLRVARKELGKKLDKADKQVSIVKPKSKKIPKIKYHKNISFENAKKLFDKAGDSSSEFIAGPTDRSEFIAFHTTDEDWNGMDYGYINWKGSNDTWGQKSLNLPDMKEAKKLGIKWILDELVVTDHDTPYEPAYPRKRFVVFEGKDHKGNPIFVTIDGGYFIKAMQVPKGWKDGQPTTFEEY
tara:strand:- start:614 stop:1534 length:921 start_codon:yes stop_codon:yes gene_type:complete